MSRVRINEGNLHSGAGIEGRRKKKQDEKTSPASKEPVERMPHQQAPPVSREQTEKKSRRKTQPVFWDAESDIFFTGREEDQPRT